MTEVYGDMRNASHRTSVKLVCRAENNILLIRNKANEVFNLVGWWADKWEHLDETIRRELLEETWLDLWIMQPKLLHVEVKHFPEWWRFDGSVNIFYLLEFSEKFVPRLEAWVYEEYRRCSRNDLENMPLSDHTNTDILFSVLE